MLNVGFWIGWHANQHNSDSPSFVLHLDVSNIPVQRRETAKAGETYRELVKALFPAIQDRQPRQRAVFSTCRLFCSRRLFLCSMLPSPGVLARCMRLVLGADRLGSLHKAAQECKANVGFIEYWCRRD